jgi:hypothetical protein
MPEAMKIFGSDARQPAVQEVILRLELSMAPSQVKVRDGTAILYELFVRDDSAPRIVLVHSHGMGRLFWMPITERLVKSASVLVCDCRGHGQSDKPKELAQRAPHEGLEIVIEFQTKRSSTDIFRTVNAEVTRRPTETFLTSDPAVETCRMLGACDLTTLPHLIAMANMTHREIAGSTPMVLPYARHLTAIEAPERTASELARLTEAAPVQ